MRLLSFLLLSLFVLLFTCGSACADMNMAEEQCALGTKYYRGDGVEQDYEKAANLWLQAARQGQPDAMFCLGLCYLDGAGVQRSQEKALWLLQGGAQLGHEDARQFLSSMGQQ